MLSAPLQILSREDFVCEQCTKAVCRSPSVNRQSSPAIFWVESGCVCVRGDIQRRAELQQEQPTGLLSRLAPVLVTRTQHFVPQRHIY